MASNKRYWKSVEELKDSSIVEKLSQSEFPEEIPTDQFLGDKDTLDTSETSRRDFLKYVGFTTMAASLAACEGPVIKSIPYVVKPDDVVPGVPDYYATTIADGNDFASVLIRVREGRPTRIEKNKLAKVGGDANARVHASVLNLYDNARLKNPTIGGQKTNWSTLDKEVKAKLDAVKANGEKIVFLTGTLASPTTEKVIKDFLGEYENAEHVVYDAISETAALDAFEAMYGERALPDYDFSKADVIISIGADFLADWQGGGYDTSYAQNRVPKNGKMSRLVQFESNMTLTGANADRRFMVKPSQQAAVLKDIYNYVVNGATPSDENVAKAAKQLKKAGSRGVLVTGVQDKNAQLVALALNKVLGSQVIDVNKPKYVRTGNSAKVAQLVKDMKSNKVGALFTCQADPAYTLANGAEFIDALRKLKLSVTFATSENDTAKASQYVATTPHYLESWGDVQMKKGHFALMQPTIRPLFDTRQFQDSLLKWSGSAQPYYEYLKSNWKSTILGGTSWNQALHDGVYTSTEEVAPAAAAPSSEEEEPAFSIASAVSSLSKADSNDLELNLYTKVSLGDGQMANNPWLQELPDPITRTSWDNYITISRIDAEANNLKNWTVSNGALDGDLVNITVDGTTIENVPVYIQPGQAPGSIGLALGYGRKNGVNENMVVGVNAYPLYKNFNTFQKVSIEKTPGRHNFACVQLQHTLMGRDEITRETTLEDFIKKPKHDWNPAPHVQMEHTNVSPDKVDLWDKFDDSIGPKFNLSIDLAKCTGCAACVVACHAENNVPVVGKSEIRKSRDMHWLRIDRYYSSDMTEEKGKQEGIFGSGKYFNAQTIPSDNPEVTFQPVMCQHCNHAPCETVCPVAATSHGRQGQNQMAYNRCVGTRYCANNCPYKVRRFNWFKYFNNDEFDYNMNNELGRMVLNPDVVVRSRGVMEKCSFCIQATQAVILKAKRENRPVKEGEFNDACACSAACGSGAMVFGDINSEKKLNELKKDERTFELLDFVGTKPNVFYQLDVRNTNEDITL